MEGTVTRKYKDKGTAKPELYPQGRFNDKPCKWCAQVFSPKATSHHYCGERCKFDARRDSYYRQQYGISLKEAEELYDAQDGRCAICRSSGYDLHGAEVFKLSLDHCHTTGKVRGFLCADCNRGLGLFRDNILSLKSAIHYLERSTTIPKGSTPEAYAGGSGEPHESE